MARQPDDDLDRVFGADVGLEPAPWPATAPDPWQAIRAALAALDAGDASRARQALQQTLRAAGWVVPD
jgi:DNA-binding GntR family transcriptional regulator